MLFKGDHRSQCEAGWALANLAHGGTNNQILEICRTKGCIEAICKCLEIKNNELIMNSLETLDTVLSVVTEWLFTLYLYRFIFLLI